MPRASKGLGRMGSKHKKASHFNVHRQLKGVDDVFQPLELATNGQALLNKEQEMSPLNTLSASSMNMSSVLAADEPREEEYGDGNRCSMQCGQSNDSDDNKAPPALLARPIMHAHSSNGTAPIAEQDEPHWSKARFPSIPGYRGTPGGSEDELNWNPTAPPCVPSDQRVERMFGSEMAAKASAAAGWLERNLPGEEGHEFDDDAEQEEAARVRYKYALRKLSAAFPELDTPVMDMCAGLHASQQRTRECPCGAGLLAQWPWVLQTVDLGFCGCEKADWEQICWRTEWISAWPGAKNISW